MTEEPTDDAGADGEPDRDDVDAPLEDLAREVRGRREARESQSAEVPPDDDLFESVDVGDVDDEAVWESFVEGETGPEERVGLGAEAERANDPDERVVPKRDFCQRCPHFAAPPETACTHEGTSIVEAVDTDRFRVRNCPVVEDEDATTRFD
ncbi:hypothetical protein [Haloplanus natans]|uniref:hypothetical protein n=1 Tax=Haloplanus natans TaxID=376171 RepID=UPI0006776EA7|nr:hypothetical protein [Haloplanus natans]